MRAGPLVAALLWLAPAPASAQARELSYDLSIDGPVTLGLVAIAGTIQLFQDDLVPAHCRWCAANGFDAGIRNALRADDGGAAGLGSDLVAMGLVPVAALGALALGASQDDRFSELPVDAAVLFETTFASLALVQVVKVLAARERPFVHALPEDEKAGTANPSDNDLSFYSGHSTFAFTLVVASATIASIRGRKIAPWIAIVGLPLAALAGTLRIVADRHYATDVIVGALAGSAFGFGIPWLLHRGPETNR